MYSSLDRKSLRCSRDELHLNLFLLFGNRPSALWQALKYLQPEDQFTNRFHLALRRSHSGHLPLSSIFQKGTGGTAEINLLTQNMNEHRKSYTGNWSDKTSEQEMEKRMQHKKTRAMFGEIIVFLCLIQMHVSPLSSPYLVVQYQRTVWHICNLLRLTWDLQVMMHDLSVLTNDERELRDKSHNLQESCDQWSWMQFQ